MTTGPAPIDSRVNAMIREFAAAQGFIGAPDHRMVYRSVDYPDTRQVWQVILGDDLYALKLDFAAGPDGRLIKEFQDLTALRQHFQTYDKLDLAEPIYLSESGQFFVTRFLLHLTSGQRLQSVDNEQTRQQVFRRAGLWLHAFHEYQPVKQNEFWGNWMPEELQRITDRQEMQADPQEVAYFAAILESQIKNLKRAKTSHAWSHGDFHSENILLGPGMTYGIDLTEARPKLAVYDIVDFLKADVYRRTPAAGIDQAGITKLHRDMFFKGYKHPINHDVLDTCLRGRLLIDWALITQRGFAERDDRRLAYRRLKNRLDIAFAKA